MDYEINNLKDYIEVINEVCLDTSRYFNNPFISFYNHNKFQNTELEKYFSAIIKNDKKKFENNPEKNETDLNKKFDTFSDDQIKFFYRGHCNSEYKLSPSVFRGNNWDYEDVYYHEMIVQCPNHFQFDSHLDKLVTMQHYDCPTRLLDITSNPLVALYFACKNFSNKDHSNIEGEVIIFSTLSKEMVYSDSDKALILSCLPRFDKDDKNKLLQKANEYLDDGKFKQVSGGSKYHDEIVEKFYHEITNEVPSFKRELIPLDLLKPLFVQPNKTNGRIVKQDGAFIISGLSSNVVDATEKLEALACAKIKIKNKTNILNELSLLGIHEASLFPEVDKVAHYLKEKIEYR